MVGDFDEINKALSAEKMESLPGWKRSLAKFALGGQVFQTMVGGAGSFTNPPKKGSNELLKAHSTLPWLHAVIDKVARAVGVNPWRLFYATDKAGKAVRNKQIQRAPIESRDKLISTLVEQGNMQEITDHPMLDFLDSGTPDNLLTGLQSRILTQKYIDLIGEACWILNRDPMLDNIPASFTLVPGTWIKRLPTAKNPTYKLEYMAIRKEIPKDDLIFFRQPRLDNPYDRGLGTAQSLADELETDEYAAAHTKTWFYNRARPDMIISAENLGRTETARLERRWIDKLRGMFNWHAPFFLNKKIDVKTLSQTFENMQLVELRRFERDTIIQVFGTSLEIMGITENSNRATIEAASYLFAEWVLTPRLEFLRDILQVRLVPEYDSRLILTYETPVRADKEYQLKIVKAVQEAFNIDEIRGMAGFQPDPEHGNLYINRGKINASDAPGRYGEEEPVEPPKNDDKSPSASDTVKADGNGKSARSHVKVPIKIIENSSSHEGDLFDSIEEGLKGQEN